MSKFKIGDKVEVINLIEDSGIVKIGDIGIVVNIEECEYPIRLKINHQTDYGFAEEELCLVDETMKEYIGILDIPRIEFMSYKILAKNFKEAENKFKNKLIEDDILDEKWIETYDGEDITIVPLFGLEVIR